MGWVTNQEALIGLGGARRMSGGVRVWGSGQEDFMGALLREECWPQPSEKIWPELTLIRVS